MTVQSVSKTAHLAKGKLCSHDETPPFSIALQPPRPPFHIHLTTPRAVSVVADTKELAVRACGSPLTQDSLVL